MKSHHRRWPRVFCARWSVVLAASWAACAEPPLVALPGDVPSAAALPFWEANAAVEWNAVARDLVIRNGTNALVAFRVYANVSVAQYHAAIAAEEGKVKNVHPSVHAAIARASADVLTFLYPAEGPALEALLAARLAAPGWPGERHTDRTAGEDIGRAVAAEVIARAQNDRFILSFSGTVPVGPGLWFSSAVPPAPPVGASLGQALTFLLTSGAQFRPPPPPAFGSPEYLAALDEVRQVAINRTPEQTAIAVFWAFPPGTYAPPGYWNEVAAGLAVEYRLNERRAAHLFALLNMTGYDGIVASHDAKFAYWFIRPTQADPTIPLAIGLPNFPSYPSNHAVISSAMATILGAEFPAEKARLDALAEEAALSRLYGAIHYRFDNETGLRLGRTIAAWALAQDVNGHRTFSLTQ